MKAQIIIGAAVSLLGLSSASSVFPRGTLVDIKARHDNGIHVRHGQRIQDAIKSAPRGSKIYIDNGTYPEQLTISTDGISLIGNGPIVEIVPPSEAVNNTCTDLAGPGTQAGICVEGANVKVGPWLGIEHRKVKSVGKPVKDVSITGLTVKGFSGANIAVVGARNALISSNTLLNGPAYGLLSAGSCDTVADNNIVSDKDIGLGFIAICMDNFSGATVSNNKVSDAVIGLCTQTNSEQITRNRVTNSCVGAYIDPHIKNTQIHNNYFGPTNPLCAQFGLPQFGIVLDGASRSDVRGNVIEGQKNGGAQVALSVLRDDVTSFQMHGAAAGGLFLFDDECKACADARPAVARENVVEGNTFRGNDVDVAYFSNGTHNRIEKNVCSRSNPKGLCK